MLYSGMTDVTVRMCTGDAKYLHIWECCLSHPAYQTSTVLLSHPHQLVRPQDTPLSVRDDLFAYTWPSCI